MSTHLVTGATGLIGSVIAEQLVGAGHDVVALVRPGTDAAGVERLGVRIVRGDLTDADSTRAAIDGCEGVFHSAAIVGIPGQELAASERVNVAGTLALLDAAAEAGVARVVYVSAAAIFDTTGTLTETSPLSPDPPTDPYTVTKTRAFLGTLERVERGQDVVIVVPGATYGPSPMGRRMVEVPGGDQRIARALRGEEASYLPMVAPWSSTVDVAAVCLGAYAKGVSGRCYLALGAPDSARSITGFVNRAMELAGSDHRVTEIGRDQLDDPSLEERFGPTILARARMSSPEPYFDASQTERSLGHTFGTLDENLVTTIEWMRSNDLV